MNLERLKRYVERCPFKELRVQSEEGVFFLGNFHTKPGWYVSFEPSWNSSSTTFERIRQKDIIVLIESMYPELYTWLVSEFP